jgi:hypothetical protein
MRPTTSPNVLPGYGSRNGSKTSLDSTQSSSSTKGYYARPPPPGTQYLHSLLHSSRTIFAVHKTQTKSLLGRRNIVAVTYGNDTLCFVLEGVNIVNISQARWENILRQDEWDVATGNVERWVVCPGQNTLYRYKLSKYEKALAERSRQPPLTGYNAQQQPLLVGWSSGDPNSRPSTSSSNNSGTSVAHKKKQRRRPWFWQR